MIARARIADNAAEWNNVAQYVNKLCEKYKNAVDPVLLTAEMHMARQQYDTAKKLLRQEAGKKVNDSRIWSRSRLGFWAPRWRSAGRSARSSAHH